MSRSFFDYTGIKELASLGVKFYNGINQRLKEPEIYQQIPTTIKGKNILIFDDVADTGESLSFTQNYLLANGAIQVKTATLFIKPWSTFMPDFYGTDTDAWIIFPCEKREMAQLLKKNWCKHGVGEENVLVRLKKLGLWRF
jgi:hypoxanthine phosphoribosyltransferase